MTQMSYEFVNGCGPMPSDRIEEILRVGKFFQLAPTTMHLPSIRGGQYCYEERTFIRCVMDGGLVADFYPEQEFRQYVTQQIEVETVARRFRAAYEVSKRIGLEVCPIAVIRSLPNMGRGLLIPRVKAKYLVFLQFVEGRGRASYKLGKATELTVNEAMVFDYLVGSGQRLWFAYRVDENGIVYSAQHFQAFSFSAAGRIAGALKKRKSQLRAEFFSKLEKFEARSSDKSDLIQTLMLLVGVQSTRNFDMILDRLLDELRLGDHVKIELVDEME